MLLFSANIEIKKTPHTLDSDTFKKKKKKSIIIWKLFIEHLQPDIS